MPSCWPQSARLLFFLSILLHELGHAVVAIRNGIPILGIDLWMFGGVAKLERDTDSPGVEFRVAVAGPIVTLAIAALCFGIGTLISSPEQVIEGSTFDTSVGSAATAVLGYLMTINVIVLLFNLIPGFPLDGGRIARAIAWKVTGDRNKATRFAAFLGRGAGYLMVGRRAGDPRDGRDDHRNLARGDRRLPGPGRQVGPGPGLVRRSHRAPARFRRDGRRAGGDPGDPDARPRRERLLPALRLGLVSGGGPSGPLVGVVSREAVNSVGADGRETRPVGSVMARDDGSSGLRAGLEDPLESLLGQESLSRLGAVMAVDSNGVLRGIVTVDAVRRALRDAVTV